MSTSEDKKSSPRKVEHNYRDFSCVSEDDVLFGDGKRSNNNNNTAAASDRSFPVKLHTMLTEIEHDGLADIVSWQPHGRCFVVHKQEAFVEKILPMYFRQSKFPSFQRQLNLYGFKRLTTGSDKNGYYHELFLRGKLFMAHRIPRCKLKGQGARKPTNPESEPNFYLMPYLPGNVIKQKKQQDEDIDQKPSISSESVATTDAYLSRDQQVSLQEIVRSGQVSAALRALQQLEINRQIATTGINLYQPVRSDLAILATAQQYAARNQGLANMIRSGHGLLCGSTGLVQSPSMQNQQLVNNNNNAIRLALLRDLYTGEVPVHVPSLLRSSYTAMNPPAPPM